VIAVAELAILPHLPASVARKAGFPLNGVKIADARQGCLGRGELGGEIRLFIKLMTTDASHEVKMGSMGESRMGPAVRGGVTPLDPSHPFAVGRVEFTDCMALDAKARAAFGA
jgi:hypothetical protein